jgi:uncharacterized protein (UPF0548 family)
MDGSDFQPLAEIAVDQVKPEHQGFTLTGQGPDHAEYRLAVHFELPLDPRTRAVLGELLSHSELTISRRAFAAPLAALRARRDRAHRP